MVCVTVELYERLYIHILLDHHCWPHMLWYHCSHHQLVPSHQQMHEAQSHLPIDTFDQICQMTQLRKDDVCVLKSNKEECKTANHIRCCCSVHACTAVFA